jgi:hypothetical protein
VHTVHRPLASQSRSYKERAACTGAGLELSHSLQHPLALAFFYAISFTSVFVAGDADRCREFAEGLAQAATKYEFPLIGGVSTFMLGAARALQKEPAAALREMEPSFEAAVAYGFFGAYPGVIMVSALADAGRNEEALSMVSCLIDSAATPQTGVFVSELWRLRESSCYGNQRANDRSRTLSARGGAHRTGTRRRDFSTESRH